MVSRYQTIEGRLDADTPPPSPSTQPLFRKQFLTESSLLTDTDAGSAVPVACYFRRPARYLVYTG